MACRDAYKRYRPAAQPLIEALPIEFDDAIINMPILYGELFPLMRTAELVKKKPGQGDDFDERAQGDG